jgi:hypothetical protein
MAMRQGDMDRLVVRVGDAEREECIATLIDHHVYGRLSVEDLDRRQRAAMSAVTTADLWLLLTDLPSQAPSRARPKGVALPQADVGSIARKAGLAAVPITALLGSALWAQSLWDLSAEGPFAGAVMGGVVVLATQALITRIRRSPHSPRPGERG